MVVIKPENTEILEIKPVKGKCKNSWQKANGLDWGQQMGESAKQSRDDFMDVQRLGDLSLNNFPE